MKFKIQNLKGIGITKIFLFLTILLAPLYVVRFKIGPYPSTLLEVLIGLTVVSWILSKPRASSFQLPLVIFFAAAVISAIVSPDQRGALGIFKAYFVEPILIYLVIKDTVKSRKDWWMVFSALGLSGLWVALLAVLQGLTGQFAFAPHEAALGRAHAVYNTANAVGLYLGPIILLGLGSLDYKLKAQNSNLKTKTQISKLRWLVLFTALVMILAIALSKSAGAAIGLIVALLLPIAYCLLPKKLVVRVVGVVGVILLLSGVWFFFSVSNFTPKTADPYMRESSDTLAFRLCLWEGTRNLLLDRPIFGAGLSGFKELYSQQYLTCDAEPLEYPHNWILNFWTETGILGLLGFLLILWQYFKCVNGKKTNAYCLMPTAFLAAMVYWLVHGLVDVPYFKNDLALEFWVILALAETLELAF